MFRKLIVMSWLFAACLGSAAAQEGMTPATKQKLAQRSYLRSLQSEHACIRNSAVFQVMQYQTRFPQEDLRPFVKVLRGLSQNDPSPQIRLYAFLAVTFLENEPLLRAAGVPPQREDEKEMYFARLQKILQSHQMLASN